MAARTLCGLCHEKESRYTCPKCLVVYCSADCYKTEAHIQCSETFYKHCVYEELASKDLKNKMHMNKHKIEDVLKQLSQAEDTELLDSDDSASEVELEDRLRNVDLDSPSDVWASLTNEEKNEFQQLVDSGKILECLPAWEPWWISDTRFIVEEIDHESSRSVAHIPSIKHPIVALSQLTTKKPSETVRYGLLNVLFSYACVSRLYLHEWDSTNAASVVKTLLLICENLSKDVNFTTAVEAIEHAQTTASNCAHVSLELISTSRNDVVLITERPNYTLAALSDVLDLFAKAKTTPELPKRLMHKCVKKLEFYLSYVGEYGVGCTPLMPDV